MLAFAMSAALLAGSAIQDPLPATAPTTTAAAYDPLRLPAATVPAPLPMAVTDPARQRELPESGGGFLRAGVDRTVNAV